MPRQPYSYRDDAAVPPFPDDRPIIIFDGMCVFCAGWVGIVLRHDRAARFRLLPAQSEIGRALYRHYGLDGSELQTNILLDAGIAWFKSESSIRMAEHLGFPWSMARALRFLPLQIRDALYDFVARNRFRWFGRRAVCYVPDAPFRERFIA